MRFIFTSLLFLAVITSHGQLKYARGFLFEKDKYEKVPVKAELSRGDYEQLPEQHSLKNYCPKPGNQLQLETSSNWAVTYGALTIQNAIVNEWNDPGMITRNAYSPVFNYALSTNFDNNGCKLQTTLADVLETLKNSGVPKYIDFQEFCPDNIPENISALSRENRITDYFRLFRENDPKEDKIKAVKKALTEDIPVIAGMICPPSFYLASDFWQPREKMDETTGGQALCVIGFDDNKYGGAFEVMNSWGSNWGNEGFMWIRYDDFADYTQTAYELFIMDQESPDEADFSGEIKLVLDNGNFLETELTKDPGYYKTKNSYRSGTNFRIYISNNETAYVYVFGTDLSNEYFKLFPYSENISPVLNYKQSSIALPGDNHHIQIIGDPGKDFLIILYSREELAIDSLLKELKALEGRIDKRLETLMSDYIIDKENIKWDSETISFNGKGKGKTLVPVYIEIEHN